MSRFSLRFRSFYLLLGLVLLLQLGSFVRNNTIINYKYTQQDNYTIDIREKLSSQFKYDNSLKFPKIIWQTWKVDLSSSKFPKRFRKWEQKWTIKNNDYVHYLLDDNKAMDFVNIIYKDIHEVTDAYKLLPSPILKADFFRYLITFAKGGVYTDIDTAPLKSIDSWASTVHDNTHAHGIGLAIGIEADANREDWNDWFARRIQFCQWTFQAKPGHPLLREIIARIVESTLLDGGREYNSKDVLEWTGPGIWTDVILGSLGSSSQNATAVTKDLSNLTTPRVLGDVMVLPITSFSPGVHHMGSKGIKDKMAYVKHYFIGSWK